MSEAPDLVQRSIQKIQFAAFSAADACYTHVAIYAGHHIIDATRQYGACERPWRAAFDGNIVKVRRYIGIGHSDQIELCNRARAPLPLPYNYLGAASAAGVVLSTRGKTAPPRVQALIDQLKRDSSAQQAAHCAELVDAAFLGKFGRSITDGTSLLPLPAAYSADTRQFADVLPSW